MSRTGIDSASSASSTSTSISSARSLLSTSASSNSAIDAPVDDTRAARIQRFARIHLTFCAPGCEQLPAEHPRRNRVFWGQPQIAVLRAILSRLQLSPAQVRVRTEDPPQWEVDLMAEVDGVDSPVASLCDGFTAAEATDLLHQLEAQGWFPMPTRPPQLEKAA